MLPDNALAASRVCGAYSLIHSMPMGHSQLGSQQVLSKRWFACPAGLQFPMSLRFPNLWTGF